MIVSSEDIERALKALKPGEPLVITGEPDDLSFEDYWFLELAKDMDNGR